METTTSPPIPENSVWLRGKQIGQGSFATVNLAIKPNTQTLFAVKSINTITSTPNQLTAIENEIKILQTLSSSPYIITYLSSDFTTTSTALYRNLHLEYIPGSYTAADVHKSNINESLLRRYTWCIVSALQYVHSKGLIHGDVKGRNILIDQVRGIAKLADFGSAGEAGIGGRGTPLWMAPEVVRGEKQGWESDVWSLGCTVIEMVTGKSVWGEDDGYWKTLMKIGYSDDHQVSMMMEEKLLVLSDEGRDFVNKCLRRESGMRWSCDELLKHPFLRLRGEEEVVGRVSPRSVIDWPEESDDDEDDEVSMVGESVEERIGKLVVGKGVNWESDDDDQEWRWVVVRGSDCDERKVEETGSEDVTGVEELLEMNREEVGPSTRVLTSELSESSESSELSESSEVEAAAACSELIKAAPEGKQSHSITCVQLLLFLSIMLCCNTNKFNDKNSRNTSSLFERYYYYFLCTFTPFCIFFISHTITTIFKTNLSLIFSIYITNKKKLHFHSQSVGRSTVGAEAAKLSIL